MKHTLLIAAIGVVMPPAFAGPELLPVHGTRYATYNVATGELTPACGPERHGDVIWASSRHTTWYWGSYRHGWAVLDWADLPAPGFVDGFQFAYGTDYVGTFDAIIWFYAEDNGWNSADRVPLAGFRIVDVPGADPDTGYASWVITVDLEGTGYEFALYGADLDASRFPGPDWSYLYWFDELPADSVTGPIISGDANDPTAYGQEHAFDTYAPADPCDLPGTYTGTWWFSGDPYCQHYLELYGAYVTTECPSPGDAGKYCWADIDGSGDCLVGTADLAQLLSNYGMTGDAKRLDGDVEPYPWGDGDVDLADLAELLSQYGDDCN